MLKTPTLINALRDEFLPYASEVRCVIHSDLHLRGKFSFERRQEGSTRGFGILASASKCIREYRDLQVLALLESLSNA